MTYRTVPAFILALFLCGCAAQRVNQFKSFAEAGRAYSTAMMELTQEAGNAAIDADSGTLILGRESWTSAERGSLLVEHTRELKELLAVLRDLRRHTKLLGDYFSVLSDMSSPDAAAGLDEEAGRLVASVQKLGSRMESARIGSAEVQEFVTAAVPLSIAGFTQKALEEELKRNGDVLNRQLELQKAVLEALTPETEADLDAVFKQRAYTDVAQPFLKDTRLPNSWIKNRREVLSGYVSLASVGNAADAAGQLGETFRKLAEGKIEPGDFEELFADIRTMIDLIELLGQSNESEEE